MTFMHKPSVAGQSIVDRALAAKHTVVGSGIAKVVCKATTEEVMGPKRKHLDYLLHCTNDSNVSIPQLANLLIERTQNSSWVVVFKALVTIHNLMNYGNERFTQFLASNSCHLNLANFTDRSSNLGYRMSVFIRRYSRYLNQKASSYRLMAFDFCKVKRGKEDGLLRTMNTEKLLKALPVVHAQLEALVEFEVEVNDLSNGVINGCFMLMFKDLIRLFACYNDGIINLLEKYFDMNKKQCKDALDVYKKFLARTDRVCVFLKIAENVGIDKGDIPDLAKAPSSLLEALEQHLTALENTKKSTATFSSSSSSSLPSTTTTITTAAPPPPKPSAGITAAISSYRQEAERGVAPGAGSSLNDISDQERALILEEEQRQLEVMRQRRLNSGSVAAPGSEAFYSVPAPRAASSTAPPPLSSAPAAAAAAQQTSVPPSINQVPPAFVEFVDSYNFSSQHADDLLGLDSALTGAAASSSSSFHPSFSSAPPHTLNGLGGFDGSGRMNGNAAFAANNPFLSSSNSNMSTAVVPAAAAAGLDVGLAWSATAATQPPLSPAFIGSTHAAAPNITPDIFGVSGVSSGSMSMLPPMSSKPAAMGGASSLHSGPAPSSSSLLSPARTISSAPMSPINTGGGGAALIDMGGGGGANTKTDRLIKSNDIDSSLANLAGNLNVKSSYLKKSEHQWKGDGGEKRLTGGAPTSSGWATSINNPPPSSSSSSPPVYWNQTSTAPLSAYPPTLQPAYPMLGGAMHPQGVLGGTAAGSYAVPMGAPVMLVPSQSSWSQQQQQQLSASDPFGAL